MCAWRLENYGVENRFRYLLCIPLLLVLVSNALVSTSS
jgi:hypothetical protein